MEIHRLKLNLNYFPSSQCYAGENIIINGGPWMIILPDKSNDTDAAFSERLNI